jgi:hypothetical protein
MTRVRALLIAAACVLAEPQALLAQPSGRLSVLGTVEYAGVTDYVGGWLGGSGGLQFHLTDASSLEIEIGGVRNRRDHGRLFLSAYDAQGRNQLLVAPYIERETNSLAFVLALISHSFGSRRARPVLWGGGGAISLGRSTHPLTSPQVPVGLTLQPGQAEAHRSRGYAAAIEGAAGIDVRLVDRITVRPFVGLGVATGGSLAGPAIIRGGARIGVRW